MKRWVTTEGLSRLDYPVTKGREEKATFSFFIWLLTSAKRCRNDDLGAVVDFTGDLTLIPTPFYVSDLLVKKRSLRSSCTTVVALI